MIASRLKVVALVLRLRDARRPVVSTTLCIAALCAAALQGCRESGALPQAVPSGDPARGAELIVTFGCGACHHVPGVPGAVGRVGPSFAAFGERTYLVGQLRNEPANLVRWIRFPHDIRPGTVMPELGVSETDAGDIAAFLYSIRSPGLGPPHPLPSDLLPAH